MSVAPAQDMIVAQGYRDCTDLGIAVDYTIEIVLVVVVHIHMEKIAHPTQEIVDPTQEIAAVAPTQEIAAVAPAQEIVAPTWEIAAVAPAQEIVAPTWEIAAPTQEIVAPTWEIVVAAPASAQADLDQLDSFDLVGFPCCRNLIKDINLGVDINAKRKLLNDILLW